jgi:hypothetical protein
VPSIQYMNKPIVTPRDAIACHVRWKITLLTAARMREPLSARATRSIEHPEECSIRKWLLSGHTVHLRGTPEYRAVFERHTKFHGEMQAIAKLLNSGEYGAAERLLQTPDRFEAASLAVANAIMALERVPTAKVAS